MGLMLYWNLKTCISFYCPESQEKADANTRYFKLFLDEAYKSHVQLVLSVKAAFWKMSGKCTMFPKLFTD